MGRVLAKDQLDDFISRLMKVGEVFAPVKTDMTRFQTITSPEQVSLEEQAFFPMKKYFMPNKEVLLHIRAGETHNVHHKNETKIVFGARLCDVNGIRVLDRMFLDGQYPDLRYKHRRENTIIIGWNCLKPPSENCFCSSMGIKKDIYDLCLHERKDDYYIDVRTEKGEKLVKHLPEDEFDFPLPKTKKKLSKKDLNSFMDYAYWEKDTDLCVGCQRCTILCPTCTCFDLRDTMDSSGDGSRVRVIDSCHSKDFTQVAGGHVFRDSRLKRYRHRIMHKLQWFKEKHGISMCTGCGRCIDHCHSKIDFVETINEDFK